MMNLLFLAMLGCDGGDAAPESTPEPQAAAAPAAASPTPASPTPATPAPGAQAGKGDVDPMAPQGGYDGIFAENRALTAVEVAHMDPSGFRVLRNEIFARYGRPFQSEDLQAHFGAQSWYAVNDDYTDDLLTPVDQQNIALIKSFEGDAAKAAAMQRGQYTQNDDQMLMIYSDAAAEVVDMTGDIYNWDRQSRHWQALGEWIVTWEGAERWTPSTASNAQLWKLDHDAGEIIEVFSL